eukprot:758579-Alexandrium_andersonii.AAC.1
MGALSGPSLARADLQSCLAGSRYTGSPVHGANVGQQKVAAPRAVDRNVMHDFACFVVNEPRAHNTTPCIGK